VSFLRSSAHRSSAPKSPPNPSLTRFRRVLSATRLENSSDIWRARQGALGLVCARSIFTTSMAQEDGHNDLLLGEEVASTTPHVSRRPTSRAARAALQRAPARASVAQSVPALNGPLMAARELLRNPPGEAASPDALRQWRDDVDRLLNLAQASPCSAGGVCPQATPSSGWRIRLCALTISEECTDRRSPGGAQPQTCGRGCPSVHRAGAWSPA
jgi:hypothetical protein